MGSINSKENSMSTTFNPYAFVASAALRNTEKEIIMMTVTPHWTELQTSHTHTHTHGWNKSCWCFKALYYRLLYGQTLSVAFLDRRRVCILGRILSCGAVCHVTVGSFGSVGNVIIRHQWGLTERGFGPEAAWNSLCFPLKSQFVATCGCERPLRGGTNTTTYTTNLERNNRISKQTSLLYNQECFSFFFFNRFFFFFSPPACLWVQCETSGVNDCVQAGSEQEEKQVSAGFPKSWVCATTDIWSSHG